jgi:hypothetical protein
MTRYRYLVDAANRAAVERVVAMRAPPADCAIVDRVDGFDAATECVLIADRMADFDPLLDAARALGATIRTATAAGELRLHTPVLAPAHERCAPRTKDEFMGALVSRLHEHVTEPTVRANGKTTLLLVHGPSGVGKTCGIALVVALLNKPGARTCRLFAVRPGEFNAQGSTKKRAKKTTGVIVAENADNNEADDDGGGGDDDPPDEEAEEAAVPPPPLESASETPVDTETPLEQPIDTETLLKELEQPIDIDTIGGEMRVAVTAAAEHCRRVRTGQLPPEAIFLLAVEDVQDVVGAAAARSIIDGIAAVARLAKAHPRNIALVATCDNQYTRAPAVQALTINKDALPFALQLQAVPALHSWQITRRIAAGFPELSKESVAVLAERANGNMWAALHMAQFGVSATSLDVADHRAACIQLRSLVSAAAEFTPYTWTPRRTEPFVTAKATLAYAAERARRSSVVERIAAASADIPFVDDVIRANFAALLPEPSPKPADDAPPEPKAITLLRLQVEFTNLEAMGGALDCLSRADVYDQHRRQSGYAGRDGQDMDKAMYDALNVVAPCLAMAVNGRIGTPNRRAPTHDRFEFKSVKARDARELAERSHELIVDVRPQLELLARRPADAELLLSRDAAWAAANPTPGRRARRAGLVHSIDAVELLLYRGAAGLETCRRAGLDKETVLRVVEFGRCMTQRGATLDELRLEYSALAKAKPAAFVPRIAESATTGAPQPKESDGAPVVALKRRANGNEIPDGKRARRAAKKKSSDAPPPSTKLVQATLPFKRKPSNLIV